jgi:hypothetical protein
VLPAVIKGLASPLDLVNRYEALRERALSRGELGRYLVTFVDNHDQVGPGDKRRYASGAFDEQVVAAIGYLLCALGTPCIYYGTEQGFSGMGPSEDSIREAMFDLDDPARSFLNPECRIYRKIADIMRVNREQPALRFGRMYFRETAPDGRGFTLPRSQPCTLAFSRLLARDEVLVAYNNSHIHREDARLRYLYGGEGDVPVERASDPSDKSRFVRLKLAPMQFVILGG